MALLDGIMVARCLELKNAELCFKKGKYFLFYHINFYRRKKGQLLNKFSKISRPTNLKRGQICFFGLEKAKPGNTGWNRLIVYLSWPAYYSLF